MNNALELNHVTVHRGSNFTLDNITLAVEKGTIMGLVGKNGAGKTTLIETIMNCLPLDSGQILYDGIALHENEITVKRKLGCVFQQLPFSTSVKPITITKTLVPFYKEFRHELYCTYMNQFQLDETKKLSTYSLGMTKIYHCILTICCNPDILLLDEPTASLDPTVRRALLDMLLEFMQDENKSILFSTHITSDLDKIADYISILHNGRLVLSKEKNELLDSYCLVQVAKNEMTDSTLEHFIDYTESSFYYEGLMLHDDASKFSNAKHIKPSIEDISQFIDSLSKGGCAHV